MLITPINESNFENIHNESQSFIDELTRLEKEGYSFRGVESTRFVAQPSAYRSAKIKENRGKFPTLHEQITTEWYYHYDIIRIIQSLYPIFENTIKCHPIIRRLFDLLSYLQVCNYLFTKYKEDHPKHIFPKDIQQMEGRNSAFWTEQKTFNYLVDYYFPKIITHEALDKSWQKNGYIDDVVTGIDMSFPQHYGTSTAALDFTKKLLVAIYFAIESHLNIEFKSENGLYIAEKSINYNDLLSIYAVKVTSNLPSSPIRFEEIDHSVPNDRAKNQQGILCYLYNPCSYYMKWGYFPKIEDYLIDGKNDHFIFKKLSLRRSIRNLDFLSEVLIKENITKKFIYPDL